MEARVFGNQEEGSAPPPDSRAGLRDLLGALLLLTMSGIFIVASFMTPFTGLQWVWYSSPTIFALTMALCLGGCSLVVARRGLAQWRASRATAPPLRWREELRAWGMPRFLIAAALILVYLVLLGRIPFLIASCGLIIVFGTAFREDSWIKGLRPSIIAAVCVVGFSMLIMKVFGIVFP